MLLNTIWQQENWNCVKIVNSENTSIPRPYGRAMGCLLRLRWRQVTARYRECSVQWIVPFCSLNDTTWTVMCPATRYFQIDTSSLWWYGIPVSLIVKRVWKKTQLEFLFSFICSNGCVWNRCSTISFSANFVKCSLISICCSTFRDTRLQHHGAVVCLVSLLLLTWLHERIQCLRWPSSSKIVLDELAEFKPSDITVDFDSLGNMTTQSNIMTSHLYGYSTGQENPSLTTRNGTIYSSPNMPPWLCLLVQHDNFGTWLSRHWPKIFSVCRIRLPNH